MDIVFLAMICSHSKTRLVFFFVFLKKTVLKTGLESPLILFFILRENKIRKKTLNVIHNRKNKYVKTESGPRVRLPMRNVTPQFPGVIFVLFLFYFIFFNITRAL